MLMKLTPGFIFNIMTFLTLYFFQRNGSSSGVLRAKTGINDINDLGQILAFNGEEKLKFWKGEKCNVIK